jgi:catechol 2,3-dioxygenase-like lactoylglutathione lyase family enzyme
VDYELELVLIPVSNVDRARDFYTQAAGFTVEVDGPAGEGARIVQVTPLGSACPVGFGAGLGLVAGHELTAAPGSQQGLHLVVDDIAAARDELIARGMPVGEIRYLEDGRWKPGLDPRQRSYMSFAKFTDADGNLWLLQEVRPGQDEKKETRDGTAR